MKLQHSARARMTADPRRAGWVQVGLMVLSIGLAYLAGQLLKPEPELLDKDKPTTLATRGSYMPWYCGVRNVGPVFAWAGDREVRQEEMGGKGFGAGMDVDVYYETGWHQIGTGPIDALHEIIQGGTVIFRGPITRESHPSGSYIDLGKEGAFYIYWGEADQPINTILGAASRVGISSRWPFCAYILWDKKRLGTSPNWKLLDYVVERRPSQSVVTGSDAWYEPTATLNGKIYTVTDVNASSNEDVGYIEVADFASADLDPGKIMRLTGNTLADGDYEVLRSSAVQVLVTTTPSGFPRYVTRTRVFLVGGTAGADDNGTIQAYTFATDDGANIAHATAELLFAPWPQGLNIDPSGPETWDIPSLNDLGTEAETLDWRASLISVDGEDADSILGNVLQDHGVMLPWDTQTGALKFVPIRKPSGTLKNISRDLYDELPEIEKYHGPRHVDRLVFQFTDRDHSFGRMSVSIGSDGQIGLMEHRRAAKIPITTTTHFATAAQLAEQRSQEELAGGAEFRLRLMRGARELVPGEAITADDFTKVLLVTGVQFDPLSEIVEVKVIPNYYGVRRSDFVNGTGGGNPNIQDPELDSRFAWIEVPEQLLATEEMFLLAARIRANSQVVGASVHLSRDNLTYTLKGGGTGVATGGILDAPLSDNTKSFLAQGPEFTLEGPDASTVLDLSADLTNWGLGRQLAVIRSEDGTEICYLQKITALGGDTYRLDGLLRARYDTRKTNHTGSPEVYIFTDTTLSEIQDILLVPDTDLYMKVQAATLGGTIPLEAVPPYSERLRGKGLVPIDVDSVRVDAPWKGSPAYGTGNDVTVKWSWSSGSSSATGAGLQAAGESIGAPVLKGSFIVELLTTGDVVVQTDTVTVPNITYPTATLAASPISEGDFKVRITHANNGFLSTPVELTITKV